MTGVLILGFLAALGVLTWVFKRWPHVQRSFDVHVDDALTVVDERDEEREAFERMIHPSAGNGLCDLERRSP